MSFLKCAALAALFLSWAAGPSAAQGNAPQREITKIAGDVYNFRNIGHNAAFMDTRDGIVLIDPINAEAAQWLKAELKQRFGKVVKYLAYSHDHPDHASGGEVFADTALFVAHTRAKEVIVNEKRRTGVPHLTFSDSMSIELGGKTVELHYVGRNHSDNSIVARFPDEKVLFAVDWIPVRALAFRDMQDSYIEEWIDSLRKVEIMEFDILAPGHGSLGKKEDVRAFRGYLEDLKAEALVAVRTGKSLDQAKAEILLPKYKDWGQYAQFRPFNVEAMYNHVRGHWRPSVFAPPSGAPKGN